MSKQWKITIPISRAEERPDGMYIVGEATGPEKDTHGSVMAPEAIVDFSRQIAERVDAGDPLPYIDSHLKVGVLRQLGNVMEGTITPEFRLKVGVRLDEYNPAARYLYDSLRAGKQYGMSIAGDGVDFQIARDESGNRFIKFMKVVLREISNTTKPSWVPSFGTVLARSVDGELGVNEMPENLDRETAPEEITVPAESEPTTEVALSEDAPAPAEEQAVTEEVTETVESEPERSTESAEATDEVEADATVEIERSRVSKKDAEALLAAYNSLRENLVALGVLTEDASKAETPESTPVENSDKGDEDHTDITEIVRAAVATEVEKATAPLVATIQSQAETIEALQNLPAGKVPAPVVRDKFDANKPNLADMSPEERLRFALSSLYSEK